MQNVAHTRLGGRKANLVTDYTLGMGSRGGHRGKIPTCHCRRRKRRRFDSWVKKIPWRRAWQPTPVSLPGESHGQRSLAGYSPWGRKSRTQLSNYTTTTTITRFRLKVECFAVLPCSVASVMSDSLQPHGLSPASLLSPWDFFRARILEWVATPSSRGSS